MYTYTFANVIETVHINAHNLESAIIKLENMQKADYKLAYIEPIYDTNHDYSDYTE